MKHFWVVFCLLVSNYSTAQVVLTFEDSSINQWSQYPVNRWKISDESPISGNYSLRHDYDNTESSRDRIAYHHQAEYTNCQITWRFQVRYHYNPSGSNNWGFFIMADNNANEMHPSGSVNGYLVGVNYSGSDDMVKLWKIASGSGYETINTNYNWQEEISPGTSVGIEVHRTTTGEWTIKIDDNGGFDNLTTIGTGDNNDYNNSSHIGLFYEYTSSADSKLWIDDISVSSTLVDSTAPFLTENHILSEDQLQLRFSELMDTNTLYDHGNYLLNDTQSPMTIESNEQEHSLITLKFNSPFNDSLANTLSIKNLKDLAGNTLTDTTLNFRYERMEVNNFQLLTDSSIKISFSKLPDSVSLMNRENYKLIPEIGFPHKIISKAMEPRNITLIYKNRFQPGVQYKLKIENVLDTSHDPVKPFLQPFIHTEIKENDLIINEIMPDPSPVIGLPEHEYIELHNPTERAVELKNWSLKTGSSKKTIPQTTILPGGFLIFCDEEAGQELQTYGKVCAFPTFPYLKNSGAEISIADSTGKTINVVHYTDDWYQDPGKNDGGYSLEKIDPLNNCSGRSNWKVSSDSAGGTPGTKNSVYASNQDTTPPQPVSLKTVAKNQLRIEYTEPLHPDLSDSVELYGLNNSLGKPYSILTNSSAPNTVDLLFSDEFIQNSHYSIAIKGIYDRCQNDTSITLDFTYHEVQPYDILINEVMADPVPAIDLPEEEYIEIYNRSEYDISIKNWKLTVGSSSRSIPKKTMAAHSFLILCKSEAMEKFIPYGEVMGIGKFPLISNSGDPIYIENEKGVVIDYCSFKPDWHENDYKKEGGWSLELIDPLNPCGKIENWSSSMDNKGGTPGMKNSIKAQNPDQMPIRIDHIFPRDSLQLVVYFKEPYKRASAGKKDLYYVDGVGYPSQVEMLSPDYKKLILHFKKPFEKHVRYSLKIKGKIADCSGNTIEPNEKHEFEIPEKPGQGDVVINEILFNPWFEGEDFVELYNCSGKTIDISALCFSNENQNIHCMRNHKRLFFPGEYLVFTKNKDMLKRQYYVPYPEKIITAENLPNFKNKKDRVVLYDKALQSLDIFEYSESMHFPLLNSQKGVSLERINFQKATDDPSNWHSSSSDAGYATPGYKNSQFTDNENNDERFHVEPEVFSPDNDGRDDLLSIQYNLQQHGYVASIKIFDKRGRIIRHLINNKTMSTEGSVIWNGLDNNNQKARVGIYIVYIELFDMKGNVESIKKRCVLGRKY